MFMRKTRILIVEKRKAHGSNAQTETREARIRGRRHRFFGQESGIIDRIQESEQRPHGHWFRCEGQQVEARADNFHHVARHPEAIRRAKLTELFGYLTKPVDAATLQAAIEVSLFKHGMEMEQMWLMVRLQQALSEVKRLRMLLPFCARCR
jgi:hypothetical protein